MDKNIRKKTIVIKPAKKVVSKLHLAISVYFSANVTGKHFDDTKCSFTHDSIGVYMTPKDSGETYLIPWANVTHVDLS